MRAYSFVFIRRDEMKVYSWSQIPEEQVNSLASRQMIHSDTMSVIRRRMLKGAVTRLHRHADEQISIVENGKLLFCVSAEERIVTTGDAVTIPSNTPHSIEAIEDSVLLDLFATPK
jgi:quercetin dioxygenase-like cupin family protein